ncbi:hypothetical protein HD806DRAFT_275684 [Xylariaceae sp. AK1471]|nr:hypothetical protein HD806DRAFT_275684 [Xylariaceae sp. AK1471]
MAAPRGKPSKTSALGKPTKPYWARTNVLCNGQIGWKVGWELDMTYNATDPQRADLRPIADVVDDLNALNSLQIQRAKPLTPLEVKQPLRHVHSSLPKPVRARIYTGDLYGSAGGVFSCPDDEFPTRMKSVFQNDIRADGELNENDFFRRLRRTEWFLWDIEAEKGHWVAVIAHLYKKDIRNPNKRKFLHNPDIPSVIPSPHFNRIDQWCVVTARRSPQGDAMVGRVKQRLPEILKEGRIRIDKDSEIDPAIWVPMDESNWSSGIRVYVLIKTLMHRVTEFYCGQVQHQQTFWDPLPGWLNVDEIRAEMQGRAAQRCLAATGYRSRIAIEGVRRYIGLKVKVRADELRPRFRENRVYETGKLDENGRCVPIKPPKPNGNNSDDGSDENDDQGPPKGPPGGPPGPPPTNVDGWSDKDSSDSSGDDDDSFRNDLFWNGPQNDPLGQEASKKAGLSKPIPMISRTRSSKQKMRSLKRKFEDAEDAYVAAATTAPVEVDNSGGPEQLVMWQQLRQETVKKFKAAVDARQQAEKILDEDDWTYDV